MVEESAVGLAEVRQRFYLEGKRQDPLVPPIGIAERRAELEAFVRIEALESVVQGNTRSIVEKLNRLVDMTEQTIEREVDVAPIEMNIDYALLSAVETVDNVYRERSESMWRVDEAWRSFRDREVAGIVARIEFAKRVDQLALSAKTYVDSQRMVQQLADITKATLDEVRDETKKHAEEAAESLRLAREVTGNAGRVKLADGFASYSTRESKTATRFRVAAFVLLTVVIVAAVVAWTVPHEVNDVANVLLRLSVVAAIAATAAYAGRQAGHHRRKADWSNAIALQLRAMPAFLESVTDEKTQHEMQLLFTRRVLQEPPSGSKRDGGGDDATALLQPLIDSMVRQQTTSS